MSTLTANKPATSQRPSQKVKGPASHEQLRQIKKPYTTELCRVDFQLYEPDAGNVFVAGTFNDWNASATPLHRQPDGKWTTVLKLKPGRYEYKFVVDGNWQADPMSWQSVRNPFDGFNSVLDVQAVSG